MSSNWTLLRRGRLHECFAALALVAVISRALIPMGFMPIVVNGEAQLRFCSGVAGGTDLAHHAHPGSTSTADAPCVFAVSGGAAAIPTAIHFALTDVAPRLAVPLAEQSTLPEAPPRYTAPRGPPSLA
jgi:hypothetical protein